MVKKFFNIFNKEIKGLHEAAYLLAIFAFLSQVLGLFRDRILAATFGTGHTLDIYYSAFRIPDFIFVTVGSMISISVLVPFIIEKIKISEEEAKEFIRNIFLFFSLLIVFFSVIVFFLIPYISSLIFKGLGSSAELILMSRILLLSPILLGLSNFFASITQVGKRFLVYALCPIFYNAGIILGIIFLYPIFGIYGLAFGVILGALLHLGIQIPFVIESGLFSLHSFKIDFESIRKVVLISIPRTITLGMTQLSIIVLLGLASYMKDGSITVFNFAMNLQSVPLAIIGVSYSIAAFPTLAKCISCGNKDEFISHIISGARHILFWSIPVSVLFIVLRAQIVRTIYGAGEFSWSSTRLTAAVLAIFAVSVVAQSLVLLFIRGYYAMGNTKKALITSIITGVTAISFSILFIKLFEFSTLFKYFVENLFRVNDILGSEILMIAFGFAAAQIINCIILWIYFEQDFSGFSVPLFNTLFQSFSASVIMGFVAYLGLNIFDTVFNINTLVGIFMQGFCSGILGIFAGVIVLKALKSTELDETWNTLHRKFWRVRTIVPDTGEL